MSEQIVLFDNTLADIITALRAVELGTEEERMNTRAVDDACILFLESLQA